jgi:hypothetical protein
MNGCVRIGKMTGVVIDGEEGYRTYGMWQANPVE